MLYSLCLCALIRCNALLLGDPDWSVRECAQTFLIQLNCPVCDQLVAEYRHNSDPEREWRIRHICAVRLSGGEWGALYNDKEWKMTKLLPWE